MKYLVHYFLVLFLSIVWMQNIEAQQDTQQDMSPLMVAADHCDHERIQTLIDEDHDVNEQYPLNGWAPLFFALNTYSLSEDRAEECHASITLLSLHQKLDVSDALGHDAIDHAVTLTNAHRDMSLIIDLLIDNFNALDRRIF